jgi:hypothetical protein
MWFSGSSPTGFASAATAGAFSSCGLPSWNQISTFLAAMRTLRDSGTWAA